MSAFSSSPSTALDAAVLNLVQEEVLQTPPGFGTESDLFAAGLDSMAIMQMLLLLEERFGVSLPVETVSRENFQSAASIARLLAARGVVVEPMVSSPPVAPVAAAPVVELKATFDRLALRDCDFFVVAFDQMLRGSGQVGHIAHSLLELDRVPDVAALKRLVAELPERYPILTARQTRRWGIGFPEWVPASKPQPVEFRLWSHEDSKGETRKHGAETFADEQRLLEDIINAPLEHGNEAWANARFDLIEKADGRCVFVYSWSHLITDGVGAEHFLVEMARLLGADYAPVPPFEKDDADARGWGARWKSAAPMVIRFYKLLERPFSSLAPKNAHPSRTQFRVVKLTEAQTAEAARRSTAISGPLLNMPFHLACAMRAHRRIFQLRGEKPESLMCCVPVQVRKKGARGPLFQNNLTMFFTSLGLDEMETVEQAATKLTEQHASFLKDKLGDAFRDLMWMMRPMPPGLHMKFILWQMKGHFSSFFHSHTGVFAPELEVFAGARVDSAYHIPGFSSPPGTGVFANEKNGRLILTFAWREGVLTKDEQDAMVEQVLTDLGAA